MSAFSTQDVVTKDDFRRVPAMRGELALTRTVSAGLPRELALNTASRDVPEWMALCIYACRTFRTLLPIVMADALALSLSGLLVQSVLSRIFPAAAHIIGGAAPLALLPLIITYWLNDLYAEIWVHPVVEFRQLTHVTLIGLLAAAAGGILAAPVPVWCLSAILPALLLVPLFRNLVRSRCVRMQAWGYPTLVIGDGDGATKIAQTLLDVPRSGLRPVIVTDFHRRCHHSVVPVINDPAMLDSIIRERLIRHAVISLPDMPSAQFAQVLDRYSSLVPHLLVLSDMATLPMLWGASRDFGRLSGIELRNGLLIFTLQCVKRGIDLSCSLVISSLMLPLIVLTALLIKLTSPGPIFYGQKRIGRNGRTFKAWKFRSMRADADAVLQDYLDANPEAREEWQRDHKLRNDPRVTWLGAFIRRTSIDELPQFWNVFNGDMSLVGPRPIVQDEVARYGDVFRLYTTVKPGITGLWQVSGRNDIDYQGRVLLDQFYIRHWSPWLDMYVIAKTVIVVLERSGAY